MRENEKKRRGTTFLTYLLVFLSLSLSSLFPIFLFSFISSFVFFSIFLLSLFFLLLPLLSLPNARSDVRSPTNFVPLVGYSFQPGGIRTRIAATGGFSSRHRVTLYPSRYIYIYPLRFSVRMNNKIMPMARRQLFGLYATFPRWSTLRFICRICAVIARLALDSKTNTPRDWNTMNHEGWSSWKHCVSLTNAFHRIPHSASFVIQDTCPPLEVALILPALERRTRLKNLFWSSIETVLILSDFNCCTFEK